MDSPSSNQVTYNDFKTGHFLLLIGRDEDPRFILLDPDPAHLKKNPDLDEDKNISVF